MPLIDMTDVLLDPDLADQFDVVRRAEAISAAGRSVVTPTTIPCQVGVVTMASPSDLVRRDDGQMISRRISIVTQFRLRGPGAGSQPDQVVLGGATYTVYDVLPYNRFGAGFIEALAECMQAAAPAQA